jgi:hypothetical protein
MKRIVALLLLGIMLPAHAESLLFGDAARGEKLHVSQCQGCHDASLYTRPDRHIRTVEGLMRQVNLCNQNLKRGLSKAQLDDLVKFLNERYYKFN